MPELPTGTVTFLFSDIEDSTPLVQRLGDNYADVQRDHQALLRAVWAAHDGVEVDTQGDSFFVVFPRAGDALAAAMEAQRQLAAHAWPAGAQVRVRMGLHTGTGVLAAPGQYVGLDVIRAARIAAAGHGGQVLLSEATQAQLLHELLQAQPEAARLRDMGRHRLKGLRAPEHVFQLVLPDLPADFPPLKTQDVWPRVRAHLAPVAVLTLALLSLAGLLLSLVFATFPRALAGWTAVTDALLVVALGAPTRVRRLAVHQWRAASKGLTAAFSVLLTLVIVVTTLFITKPPIFLGPAHLGYDFSYTSHAPTHTGDAIKIAAWCPNPTLARGGLGYPGSRCMGGVYQGLWQSCVVQLPDLTLGLDGWKPDQCTEVPTVANDGETLDERTTTFHIDPKAVWSDGTPIIADDFLFAHRLFADPNVNIFSTAPFDLMRLTEPDPRTVKVAWSKPYGDYLTALAAMPPLPLHVYATGAFAGVYDPRTDAYDSAFAQKLVQTTGFNQTIAVDNGPFTVRSYPPNANGPRLAGPAVLGRNPRFFSNYFHHPAALDQVTLISGFQEAPVDKTGNPSKAQQQALLIAQYQQGQLMLVQGLEPLNLRQVAGIPTGEVVTSPVNNLIEYGFNLRGVAPNARANGGASMFADRTVRQAFVEAFDRCAAVRALLGIRNCTDPNLHSDENTAPPSPDYDATFSLSAYNPADAARLLDRAGYRVVNGIRRGKDGKTPLQLRLALSFAATPSAGLARSMRQDYARNLHVAVTIVPVEKWDVVAGNFDFALVGNGGPPDPVGSFTYGANGSDAAADIPSVQNPSGQNWTGIIDPYLTQRDQVGSQTLDDKQRAAVYKALQRYYSQQLYYVPAYIEADVTLVRPTLCNFKQWPNPDTATWNMADWYVAPSCP